MLAVTKYPADYIASVRALIDERVAGFRELGDVPPQVAASFYADLALVLELAFVHRQRKDEGKDGNPLNELRLLAVSLLTNGGRMVDGKPLKVRPETSILGLAEGDTVTLTERDLLRLTDGVVAAVTKRFSE
ncbi:hypothetical protein AB0M20_21200 [Actinoplanes sp. NPDC051633]|uniref:hypothetical protein n=1 Tax=Actinoplanes sp. NPDC051633 TaxID=3155670 RepID=UPI00341A4239